MASLQGLTVKNIKPLKNVDPEYDVSSQHDCVLASAG
jgi:hypothetical protein